MIQISPPRPQRENVIPLINVVFLLLVFFMIAGQMAPPEMLAISPPEIRSEQELATLEERLLVDADGVIMLGEQTLTTATIADHISTDRTDPLMVKIDQSCNRDCFLPVLSALSTAGIRQVKLITLQQAAPSHP